MSYYYSKSGSLSYNHAYSAPHITPISTSSSNIQFDPIRPSSLYVHSDHEITNGNLAKWKGTASMYDRNGSQINAYSSQSGHEFAIGRVEENDEIYSQEIAGVVIEKSAEPGDYVFKHKGVHSDHPMNNNTKYIHRLATSGSCVLAWVLLDEHEGELDGVYIEHLNGVAIGKAVVRELGANHFTMERIGNDDFQTLQTQVDTLQSRLDELTGE